MKVKTFLTNYSNLIQEYKRDNDNYQDFYNDVSALRSSISRLNRDSELRVDQGLGRLALEIWDES